MNLGVALFQVSLAVMISLAVVGLLIDWLHGVVKSS